MYQKFQEYFKGNNIRILLKYDGEREKNLYTVLIFDKNAYECIFRKDTDDPFRSFNFFIEELHTSANENLNRDYYAEFEIMKNKLNEFLSCKMVFSLTSEMNSNKIIHRILIIDKNLDFHFTSRSFCRINKKIKRLKKNMKKQAAKINKPKKI